MKLKDLREKIRDAIGVSQKELDDLRELRMETATKRLIQWSALASTGQPIQHGVNARATAKRRARNKAARAQRRRNRG